MVSIAKTEPHWLAMKKMVQRSLPTFASALLFSMAISTHVDAASSAKSGRNDYKNAIDTDINISGPFLQNLTKDPHSPMSAVRCGEPQLAQDAKNPNILVAACATEIWLNYQTTAPARYFPYQDPTKEDNGKPCYTFISRDGGDSWKPVNPNPLRTEAAHKCMDPLLTSGPNGEIYLGGDTLHTPANGQYGVIVNASGSSYPWETLGIGFTRTLDGGKTWSKPVTIPTQVDRPFMVTDQSTNVIYEVSGCSFYNLTTKRGGYGCTTTSRNLAVSTDRGSTWSPIVDMKTDNLPTTTLTEGHLHNIAPHGATVIAAAMGVFAGAGIGEKESLQSPVGSGTTGASPQKAVYFQYSTDRGLTFTHHEVPLGSAMPCPNPTTSSLTADPTHRGTFALVILCGPNAHAVRVFLTRDLGATWSETADLASVPAPSYQGELSPFGINRPSINFGPSGALAVMWREAYCGQTAESGCPAYGPGNSSSSFMPASIAVSGCCTPGPQDVFVSISKDGGTTFTSPIRVNTAASPSGDPRQWSIDDVSHVIVDKNFAYVAWGDWRSGEMEIWFRKVRLQ